MSEEFTIPPTHEVFYDGDSVEVRIVTDRTDVENATQSDDYGDELLETSARGRSPQASVDNLVENTALEAAIAECNVVLLDGANVTHDEDGGYVCQAMVGYFVK